MLLCEWMQTLRTSVVACLLASLVVWPGCQQAEWSWGEQHVRRPGQVIQPTPSPPTRTDSDKPAAAPADSAPPTGADKPADKPAAIEPAFSLVVLLSGSSSPGEPERGVTQIQTQRSSARQAGELLSWLYVPTGSGGTTDRYTLIYPTPAEAADAARIVNDLDVPAIVETPAALSTDNRQAFAVALGLIAAAPHGSPGARERLGVAEPGLVRMYEATGQPRLLRWAAGMIAGRLRAERFDDYDRALTHFQAAGDMAQADSYERMAALSAQSRAHIQLGRPDVARRMLSSLLVTFKRFEATEVCARSRRMLDDLSGKAPR